MLGCMGRSGDQATLTEARKRFEAHCKGESTISADLRSAVYSTVLKHGDDNTLESVMNLFKEADLHEEKVRLMRCMGAVSQPDLIKKVLEFSMSVSLVASAFNSRPFGFRSLTPSIMGEVLFFWQRANCSSILEPFCNNYTDTKEFLLGCVG